MTIRELAKLTGKSYATVSRALNDNPKVALKTKEDIKRIAREAGYNINAGAKSLATGIHMTVGVLYPYQHLRAVESVYTVRLTHLIRNELTKYGFDTLIHGYDTIGEDTTEVTRLVRQKKVDGLLIMGYEITEEAVLETARYTDRFLLINPVHEPWVRQYDHIMIDHYHGGALAARALLERGQRKLATVAEESPQFRVRMDGFLSEACKVSGVTVSHFRLDSGSYEDAYRLGTAQAGELKDVDGVFVQSDNSAFGILNALQDGGIKVPGDVSIIGYDDVDWCAYSRPSLSTIHQPKTDVAVMAVKAITSRVLHGKEGQVMAMLKPHYVQRESC